MVEQSSCFNLYINRLIVGQYDIMVDKFVITEGSNICEIELCVC